MDKSKPKIMFESTGGIENSYRLLLGDEVVDSMIQTIGEANANRFLKLHAKYDALSRRNPEADPLRKMPAHDIPAFEDFESYVKFLNKIEFTLRTFKEPISKALYAVIKEMIALADKKQAKQDKQEVTSATYQNSMLRGNTLIHVPVPLLEMDKFRYTGVFPYSYPSFEATLEIVRNYADDKDFVKRLEAELTDTLKASLVRVVAELSKEQKKSIPELVVEAQEYLMSRNWIKYNLENVAQASFNIAKAGLKHQVTTNGVIKHVSGSRTLAFAFLGLNLERALRRGFFALLKDITNSVNLAGREAGFDVLTAACSYFVQDHARQWLDNLQSKLK